MDTSYTYILDTPNSTSADGDATTSRHPIARLGTYKDPRYGKFEITPKDYEQWKKNLHSIQHGRIPIDYDHGSDKTNGSTKAAGWIKELELDGDQVIADIDWTPEGADAVKNKYWQFVSPSFTTRYRDEQDRDQGAALVAVALTNRPFLRKGMPAINLSQALDAVAERIEAGIATGDTQSDMPQAEKESTVNKDEGMAMPEKSTTAQLEAATIQAISLEQQAAAEGKVLLSQADLDDLTAKAEKGEEAAKQLHQQKFETAYDKASEEGRVDAKTETRERWEKLYDSNPSVTLDALADLPKVINLDAPRGENGKVSDAPDGHDAERFELHQKAEAYAEKKGVSYEDALIALDSEGV